MIDNSKPLWQTRQFLELEGTIDNIAFLLAKT